MTSTKPGVLRRLSERLTSPAHELEAAELRRESDDLGVIHIGEVTQRTLVTVCGEVRSVTLRPRDETPALDVALGDGRDSLHHIRLGRRRNAGIVPRSALTSSGSG